MDRRSYTAHVPSLPPYDPRPLQPIGLDLLPASRPCSSWVFFYMGGLSFPLAVPLSASVSVPPSRFLVVLVYTNGRKGGGRRRCVRLGRVCWLV